MPESPSLPRNRPVLALVTAHWLAQLGLGLVLTALASWLFLVPVRLRHGEDNPYIGLAMFVAVPAVLLAGVVLTPLGLWLGRRRLRERLAAGIDDRRLALRRLLAFLLVTTALNLVIGTQFTTRAVHHMESREFCASCHVMAPESVAFDPGSHAGLQCVDCHVGSGLEGFLASKLQGTRQLWHVLTDQVEVPIPSGIASGRMVPSAETCERCHWKERPAALKLKVARRHAEDEANTVETTVLTMHVGGTRMGGIHGAHISPGVEIRFVATDPARQDIPWVELSSSVTGERRTYVRKDAKERSFAGVQPVTMECIDCHNRAAHAFMSPERAVDVALTFGLVSSSLPFLKKKGVELLRESWESAEEAARGIPAALADSYRAEYPELLSSRAADVEEAGRVLAELWSRNVYPELGVTWGTYPDNRGHQESPGCFRCHAGEHTTETGETITNNCFRCHSASAVGDANPEVLDVLGLERPIEQMRAK
jgi:nitrate/TMAO reductase-like tetraheme cytochrome c subunit